MLEPTPTSPTPPPPAPPQPLAPTMPPTPVPSRAANAPPPPRRKKSIGAWFVGLLIPIVLFAIYIALLKVTEFVGYATEIAAYLDSAGDILIVVALSPMILAAYLGVPGMGMAIAGFGFPSPLGLLVNAVAWAIVGRILYALHHMSKSVFWILVVVALAVFGYFTYMGAADFRAIDAARATGNPAACDQFVGDDQFVVEQRGYCLIEAAVGANDPTMCDSIPGYQRTACYNRLNAPYIPLPGMK